MELAQLANEYVCLTDRTVTGAVELHDVGVVDPGQLTTLWRKHRETLKTIDTHADCKHMKRPRSSSWQTQFNLFLKQNAYTD